MTQKRQKYWETAQCATESETTHKLGIYKWWFELDEQIMKSLIKKAERRKFRKSLIVMIITDEEIIKTSKFS
jgi:hypothetical protein